MSDWYKSSERTDYLGREISLDSFDYSVSKSLFGLVLISPRNRSFFDQTMILLFLKNFLKGPFQGSFIGAEEKDQNVFVGLLLLLTPGKSFRKFCETFLANFKTLLAMVLLLSLAWLAIGELRVSPSKVDHYRTTTLF